MTFTPWCDPTDVVEKVACTTEQGSDAATAASLLLWRLSGRRYGVADVKLRPTRLRELQPGDGPLWDVGWGLPLPYPGPGPFGGISFGWGLSTPWACGTHLGDRELELPSTVTAVTAVAEDGVTLATGSYRYDRPDRLVRTDGGRWRRHQDFTLADGAPGTWSVSLTVGRPIPADGAAAALELACEIAKDMLGKPCRLPQRTTQITKQGATFLLTDPMAVIRAGGVGLVRVDMWIGSVNPTKQTMQPGIYIPGDDLDDQYRVV